MNLKIEISTFCCYWCCEVGLDLSSTENKIQAYLMRLSVGLLQV